MDTTVKHDPATELYQHLLSERFGTRALGVTAQLKDFFVSCHALHMGYKGVNRS